MTFFEGIWLTHLPMLFTLQFQTLDTLIFCVVNGLISLFWIVFMLQMPIGDQLHMLFIGNFLIPCFVFWQQREQERMERVSFEQDLILERGFLLRSADRLVRGFVQHADHRTNMELLHRARSVRAESLGL